MNDYGVWVSPLLLPNDLWATFIITLRTKITDTECMKTLLYMVLKKNRKPGTSSNWWHFLRTFKRTIFGILQLILLAIGYSFDILAVQGRKWQMTFKASVWLCLASLRDSSIAKCIWSTPQYNQQIKILPDGKTWNQPLPSKWFSPNIYMDLHWFQIWSSMETFVYFKTYSRK